MGKPKRENFRPKIYTPHEEFARYMRNFLQFLKNEGSFKDAGEKEGNLRRMKNYYLNEHVFPSMANIVFFFEAISKYPELQSEFELDIKDLLGVRRIGPRADNYAYVFLTLIHTMIHTKKGYKDNNFRIRLIHELQKLVRYRMQDLSIKSFGHGNVLRHVNEDIERAEAWSESIAAKVDEEYDFEAPESIYNPVPIPPQYLENESKKREYEEKISKERQEKWVDYCLKSNGPNRSLYFSVEEMLEN